MFLTNGSTARMMWHDYGGRLATGFGGWGTDYPGGDRNLIEGVRRLTSIDVRSVEQAVEIDGSDDLYNWPFLYAVEVGRWSLDEKEGKQLREFLDRGGFLMVDDFHGRQEWAGFGRGHSPSVSNGRHRRPPAIRADLPHAVRRGSEGPGRWRAALYNEANSMSAQMIRFRAGAGSATRRAASWSRSATTWTWATPGSFRMSPTIPRKWPPPRTAFWSITLPAI